MFGRGSVVCAGGGFSQHLSSVEKLLRFNPVRDCRRRAVFWVLVVVHVEEFPFVRNRTGRIYRKH